MTRDTSTINRDVLRTFPAKDLPHTYRPGDEGMGCFGHPPGHPSYFVQPVYTHHGNHPGRKGEPTVRLFGHTIETAGAWLEDEARTALYRSLYLPLPFEHPRVQAWVHATFKHLAHCYCDEERQEYGRPGTLVYPVPCYKLKSPRIDPHWTDEYKAAVQHEADVFNTEERARADRIATPENYQAVRAVREWYPEQDPAALMARYAPIAAASPYGPGDWWERHDAQPTPEECRPPRWFGAHRTDGWCQFCGHVTAPATE